MTAINQLPKDGDLGPDYVRHGLSSNSNHMNYPELENVFMTQRETNREAESVHHRMILDKTGWGKETKESNNKEHETDRRPASGGFGSTI